MTRCTETVFPGTPIQYHCSCTIDESGDCTNPECPSNRPVPRAPYGGREKEVRGGVYPADFGMGGNAPEHQPEPAGNVALGADVESHLQSDGRVKNGTYTLVSDKTGQHRTLRLSTIQNKRSGLYGKRVISLLTGPNNEDDYTGFGFVLDDNSLKVWRSFAGSLTEKIGVALLTILRRGRVQADGSVVADGLRGHVLFKSACRVCNRPLTCPESIRTGIGPVCAGRSE